MEGARGLRVLEVGERLGPAAAGLALVALGAEVVQARPTGRRIGAPEAAYYDRGRLVLEGRSGLDILGAAADVVLTDLDQEALSVRGLPADESALRGGERPQVLVSIRSFGRDGPNAAFRMTDLTDWASGGLAGVTRRPFPDDPERYVPVVPPGFQPQALAGLAAAAGLLAGRRLAEGGRQPVVVDVSVQEVTAAILHSIVPPFVWNNHVLGHPSTPTNAIGLLLPAADGDVYIRTVEGHQWEKLMDWLGQPDWAAIGADPYQRLANMAAIQALIGEWTSTQKRLELLVEGQRRKVPIALPRSVAEVLAWQQLRARGAWTAVDFQGRTGEVPRVPMLEPPAWPLGRGCGAGEIAERWGAP